MPPKKVKIILLFPHKYKDKLICDAEQIWTNYEIIITNLITAFTKRQKIIFARKNLRS